MNAAYSKIVKKKFCNTGTQDEPAFYGGQLCPRGFSSAVTSVNGGQHLGKRNIWLCIVVCYYLLLASSSRSQLTAHNTLDALIAARTLLYYPSQQGFASNPLSGLANVKYRGNFAGQHVTALTLRFRPSSTRKR